MNDKISMLKHKKVDTTTLGQVNQQELIRAVCTFEQVDYKTEISKYLYSRINCFDVFCVTRKMCLKRLTAWKTINRELRQLTLLIQLVPNMPLLSSAIHQGVDGDSLQALLVIYFHSALSFTNKTPQWQKLLDLLSKEEISEEAHPPWEASSRKPSTGGTLWLPNKRYFISNMHFFPPLFPMPLHLPRPLQYSWFLSYSLYSSSRWKST